MDRTATFYSQPSYVQRGAGLPVYSGSRRQRGGSVLGAVKNFIMPIVSSLKNRAIRRVKGETWRLAKGLAADAITGRNMVQSVKNRGLQSVKRLGKNTAIDTAASIVRAASGNRTAPIHPGTASRKRKAPLKKRTLAKKRRVQNF